MNRLTTITDPLGNQTVLGYDSDGNRTTVTDPMGRVTTTQYDALDRPTVVIDPMGNVTTTTYDADGKVLNGDGPPGPGHVRPYTIAGAGSRPITDPLGKTTTYTYTPMGLRSGLSMQAASGVAVAYSIYLQCRQRA